MTPQGPESESVGVVESATRLFQWLAAEGDRVLGRKPRTLVRGEPIPCVGRSAAVRVVGLGRRCTA